MVKICGILVLVLALVVRGAAVFMARGVVVLVVRGAAVSVVLGEEAAVLGAAAAVGETHLRADGGNV